MLTPQLQAQIEQEAISLTSDRSGDDFHSGYNQGIEKGYMVCAEKYASLWQQAEQWVADLNLALAAMLNGYQNLSIHQMDWFTVPKDLIDQYTKMVMEYNPKTTNDAAE